MPRDRLARWFGWGQGAEVTRRAVPDGAPLASIVLVTYNRLRMLERCVRSVVETTRGVDCEILVWDNASTDGTREFLDEVASHDPRLRVVHSDENVGLNGVARGVALAGGAYIVEMDDDILWHPDGWLEEMIRCFDRVPRAGYLAADVICDETTNGAKPTSEHYKIRDYGSGVVLEIGPTGGWCTMTSRAVIDAIGSFTEMPGRIFFSEDGEFANRCRRRHYRVGIVRSVRVYHASGLEANEAFGYLDVCETKYADDAEYRAFLESARAMRDTPSKR